MGYGDDVLTIRFSAVNLRWLTVQDCALTFRWCWVIPLAPGSHCGNPSRPVLAVPPHSGSLRHRHAEPPVDTQVRKTSLCYSVQRLGKYIIQHLDHLGGKVNTWVLIWDACCDDPCHGKETAGEVAAEVECLYAQKCWCCWCLICFCQSLHCQVLSEEREA